MSLERSSVSFKVAVPTPPLPGPNLQDMYQFMEARRSSNQRGNCDYTTNAEAFKVINFTHGGKLKIDIKWHLKLNHSVSKNVHEHRWLHDFVVLLTPSGGIQSLAMTFGILSRPIDDSESFLYFGDGCRGRNYINFPFASNNQGLTTTATRDGSLIFKFDVEFDQVKPSIPKSVRIPITITNKVKMDVKNNPDVWLVAKDGEKIPCLKYFLKLRSKHFQAMLDNPDSDEAQTGEIRIKDYDKETLKAFADFIVFDSTDSWIGKDGQIAINLLALGDRYMIEELVSAAKDAVSQQLSANNVSAILELAEKTIGVQDLADRALQFMAVTGKVSDDQIDGMSTEVLRRQFKLLLKHKR